MSGPPRTAGRHIATSAGSNRSRSVIPERGAPGNRPGFRCVDPGVRPAIRRRARAYSRGLVFLGLVVLTGVVVAPAHAQSDTPPRVALSIDDAVDRAIRSNERARIARAAVDRTRGIVREAFARALPTIEGSYRLTRNLQRPVIFFNQDGETTQISIGDEQEHAFGISVEQPIFDLSLGAALSAARHGNAASEAAYERTLTEITLVARQAYLDVLLAREALETRRAAVELAAAREAQVRLFFDVGTASEFDLLTAQVDLENAKPALIRAENEARLAENRLKRVVGLGLDAPLDLLDTLEYVPVSVTLDDATALAMASRADLEAQRQTVEVRERLVSVERSEAYPTLQLRLDLTRRASSDEFVPDDRDFNQSASAQLALDIPIFDGRRSQGRALQASADYIEAIETHRALREDVQLQVQDAWQTTAAAAQLVEATRATVGRAERAYDIAATRFRNGLSTQLELDEAEQGLIEARLNAAQALHAHMLAAAGLDAATGTR